MKPMKIADVKKRTGVSSMTVAQASKIANASDPFLYNMACALSLHTWHNSEADWLRLQAALVLLAAKRRRVS
jgi:hypothetical protein